MNFVNACGKVIAELKQFGYEIERDEDRIKLYKNGKHRHSYHIMDLDLARCFETALMEDSDYQEAVLKELDIVLGYSTPKASVRKSGGVTFASSLNENTLINILYEYQANKEENLSNAEIVCTELLNRRPPLNKILGLIQFFELQNSSMLRSAKKVDNDVIRDLDKLNIAP